MSKAIIVLAMVGCFAAGTLTANLQNPARFTGRSFTHIGVIVRDVEKSAKAYADVWGVEMPPIAGNRPIPFPPSYQGNRNARVKNAMIRLDNIAIELLEPLGGPSPWFDHLQKYGESLHHIAFGVDSLSGSISALQGKGGEWVMGGVDGAPFAYVDMKPQLGFTIELSGPSPPAK